jgi:hypothetical protein
MRAERSKNRRLLLTVGLLVALGLVATCAELMRRDHDRQERLAIMDLMGQAMAGHDPTGLDERWPRFREEVHAEIRAQPLGELALYAHRAASAMRTAVPQTGYPERPFIVVLEYGNEAIARAVLPEDQPFRWEFEVHGSWDHGPWLPIDQVSWSERTPKTNRQDLHQLLPPEAFAEGMHVLQLRGTRELFLPPTAAEPIHVEGVDLGRHPIRVGDPRPTAAGR